MSAIGLLGVLAAGCSGSTQTPTTSTPTMTNGGTVPSSAPASTPSTPSTPSTAPAAGGGGAPPAGENGNTGQNGNTGNGNTGNDAGNPDRCTTGELAGSIGSTDGAAGSVNTELVLTNTSSRTCELRGFPGVSYVAGNDGHQVGPAAEMEGDHGTAVRLEPGQAVVAPVRQVNVQNFDPAACRPTAVRGLRVYPPGDTASLFVPLEGTGCASDPGQPQLFVRHVEPR